MLRTIPTLYILGEMADQDLTCTGGLQQGVLPPGQTSYHLSLAAYTV